MPCCNPPPILPLFGCNFAVRYIIIIISSSSSIVIVIIIIIIIYPLTARVVGAPQTISQPVSSIFACCPLPSWTWWTPGLSIHFLMLSSHLFLCLPCLLPPFTAPCKMALARPNERKTWPYQVVGRLSGLTPGFHTKWYRVDHTTAVCFSSRWSGGLRVVRLPAVRYK